MEKKISFIRLKKIKIFQEVM